MRKIKVQDDTAKTSMIIAVVLHLIVIGFVAWFFRSEIQAMTKKIIDVVMQEKKKAKEEKKEELAKETKSATPEVKDLPKIESAAAPPPTAANSASTANNDAPPAAAPAAVGGDAGWFSDGAKVVETVNDPIALYQRQIERAFHLNWMKPDDIADGQNAAEAEVEIDPKGRVVRYGWLKGSGNPKWDDSVKKALAVTSNVRIEPPKGFPSKFNVRFDVTADATNPSDNLIQ